MSEKKEWVIEEVCPEDALHSFNDWLKGKIIKESRPFIGGGNNFTSKHDTKNYRGYYLLWGIEDLPSRLRDSYDVKLRNDHVEICFANVKLRPHKREPQDLKKEENTKRFIWF